MRKFILLSLTVTITIFIVYVLVYKIGLQGFLFAWMLNLVLMMCVYFFTETLKSEFKSAYYQEKTWEKKGKIYETFGINWFRKLLVLIGWEKMNKKSQSRRKKLARFSSFRIQYQTIRIRAYHHLFHCFSLHYIRWD